jgi:hypothetical protein
MRRRLSAMSPGRPLGPLGLLFIEQIDDAEEPVRPAAPRDHAGPEAEAVEIDLAIHVADAVRIHVIGHQLRHEVGVQVAAMGAGEGRVLDQLHRRIGIAENHLHDVIAGFAGLGRLRVRGTHRQQAGPPGVGTQQGGATKCGRADPCGAEEEVLYDPSSSSKPLRFI